MLLNTGRHASGGMDGCTAGCDLSFWTCYRLSVGNCIFPIRWNTTVMLPIGRNVKSANYPPQKD